MIYKKVYVDDKRIDHFAELITLINQRIQLYREQSKSIIFLQHCDEELIQTQHCIDVAIKFAHGLGYRLTMLKNASTTYDNDFLSAADTIAFYENI